MSLIGNYIQVYKPEVHVTETATKPPNADLLSPKLQAKETTDCFSFYYYIHGEGVGEISLNIVTSAKSERIWVRKESAGDKWHLSKINIGSQKTNYQVNITFKTYMSLDN